MVMAVIEDGIHPDVMELLQARGIDHYTLWQDLEGAGETGPKHGNPVWPGLNNMLMLVLDEEQVEPFIEAMHKLRDSYPVTPGMRFIITDVRFV